jgi:hypothetical protein
VIKNFVRHAIVSDMKMLIPFMGPLMASMGQYSYDPVPPVDPRTTSYDDDYLSSAAPDPGRGKAAERAAATRTGRRRGGERMEIDPVEFLAMLEAAFQGPDNDVRAHLLDGLAEPVAEAGLRPVEQWLRQNQAIEAQFPHAARFLLANREERQRLVLAQEGEGAGPAAVPGAIGGAHVPGGFAGDVLEEQQAAESSDEAREGEEEEDTDEEGEGVSTLFDYDDVWVYTVARADYLQAPILPVRLARSIMNLFWGRGASAPEESSEEDDVDLPPQASDVD